MGGIGYAGLFFFASGRLFGVHKGDPLKIRERDRVRAFDSRHLMGGHNNQPKLVSVVGGRGDVGEGA